MFPWSRWESWLAVVCSVLLVAGGLAHWWLDHSTGRSGLPVIVEPAAAAAPAPALAQASAGESRGASGGEDSGAPGAAHAPCPPSAGDGSGSGAGPSGGDIRIDINRAPASELERLPGIGPALAQRIVAYREEWGPFNDIRDILEVPGIGPAKFNAIQDLIKVE